ncbi:unnamed protein product [Nezara viridula]|uniref:COX assembly mitochondrial protein n=1 Tax=Nezara viridula TaxID=85310 RepID=A0A9P0MYH8_NEZVI|nr:unnamed protein product [Nezara viridula]
MVGTEKTSHIQTDLGPHGLGDPDDKSLRKVETEILIPKKMRDKAKAENCFSEVQDFQKCCKESGVLLVMKCRKENNKMKECLTHWYRNPEFVNKCTEEYLEERSEYRRTGIKKRDKLMKI